MKTTVERNLNANKNVYAQHSASYSKFNAKWNCVICINFQHFYSGWTYCNSVQWIVRLFMFVIIVEWEDGSYQHIEDIDTGHPVNKKYFYFESNAILNDRYYFENLLVRLKDRHHSMAKLWICTEQPGQNQIRFE